MPRRTIARSYSSSIFDLFRKLDTILHCGCTNLRSYQVSPYRHIPPPAKLFLPFFLKSWTQIDYDSVSINCEYCMIHIFQCSFIKARLKSKPVEDNLGYFHILLHSNVLNSGSLCGPGLVLKLLCSENLLKETPSHREKKNISIIYYELAFQKL